MWDETAAGAVSSRPRTSGIPLRDDHEDASIDGFGRPMVRWGTRTTAGPPQVVWHMSPTRCTSYG